MFLVVLGHVFLFTFGNSAGSFVSSLFLTFRMPLFFFISGFIAYKAKSFWTIENWKTSVNKKARIQLIPTIVFFLLYYTLVENDCVSHFQNNGFGRFWFTFVLFEMFLLYFSFSCISNICYFSEFYILISIGIVCIAFSLFHYDDYQWCRILRIRDLVTYFPYFIFGLLARKEEKKFTSIIECDTCRTMFLILFVALLIIIHGNLSNHPIIINTIKVSNVYIVRWIGLLLVVSIFANNKHFFEQGARLSRIMQFVGRRTLDIYMLHYFFLPSLPQLGEFFDNNSNPLLELLVGSLVAACVLSISLFVSWIIRNSNFCAFYLFGVKNTTSKDKKFTLS